MRSSRQVMHPLTYLGYSLIWIYPMRITSNTFSSGSHRLLQLGGSLRNIFYASLYSKLRNMWSRAEFYKLWPIHGWWNQFSDLWLASLFNEIKQKVESTVCYKRYYSVKHFFSVFNILCMLVYCAYCVSIFCILWCHGKCATYYGAYPNHLGSDWLRAVASKSGTKTSSFLPHPVLPGRKNLLVCENGWAISSECTSLKRFLQLKNEEDLSNQCPQLEQWGTSRLIKDHNLR